MAKTMSSERHVRKVGSIVLVLTVALVAGCARDPNVRKQKYLASGNSYFDQSKYREAAIQYLNAVQIDKGYAEAHYRLAQCYLRQGIWAGAYQELLRTTELQPDNTRAQIDLGTLLLSAKQFKRAEESAQNVLSRDPENVDARVLLANSYAALEDVGESLREMQTVIGLAPDQPRVYLNMAYLQLNAKQATAAEQNFLKAIELDPKSIPARLAIGNFYQQQRRWKEAEEQFRQAIQGAPKNPLAYAAMASLFENQNRRNEAEQILLQAKQAMPDIPDGYTLLGQFYFLTNDLPRATDEYASLVQQHPKDERVQKSYIEALVLGNRLNEASKLDEQLIKAYPKDVDALILRGQILNAQGQSDQAVHSLEAALKEDPQNPSAHYSLGITLVTMGNNGRGIGELQEAIRLRPNMTQGYQALGQVALRKGDLDLLRQSAEGLIAALPASPEGYLMRATASLNAKDANAAEKDLQRAIAIAPDNSRGFTGMGQLRLTQKRLVEAGTFFGQAITKNPHDLQALAGLAQLNLIQKQPAQAISRIEQQIARFPDDGGMYLLLGQVQLGMKDYAAAEKSLTKAVDFSPTVDAILALTTAQIARGSVQQAIESYQKAIRQDPRDIRAYVLLGSFQELQGNWREAQQQYEKVLSLQPNNPAAANNLAYILLEHGGNTDVALSLAQTARRLMPDSPNTADTLAWAYINKSAFALAVDLLQEATNASPANPIYHYHLGVAYQKSNDEARAKTQFERALELNPPYPEADEIHKALAKTHGG